MSYAMLSKLVQQYPTVTLSKGETLLLKNEVPKTMHIIEKGILQSYTITQDGAERQVSIYIVGDAVPVGFALGLTKRSEYFYRAYTNCVVRNVPVNAFIRLLKRNPDILFERYRRVVSELVTSMSHITALEHPKASDKVAFMLMTLASQFSSRFLPYQTKLQLSMTQQEMADALGLARETTGNELKKLEFKKIISHSRKSYTLYLERMRNYLDGR